MPFDLPGVPILRPALTPYEPFLPAAQHLYRWLVIVLSFFSFLIFQVYSFSFQFMVPHSFVFGHFSSSFPWSPAGGHGFSFFAVAAFLLPFLPCMVVPQLPACAAPPPPRRPAAACCTRAFAAPRRAAARRVLARVLRLLQVPRSPFLYFPRRRLPPYLTYTPLPTTLLCTTGFAFAYCPHLAAFPTTAHTFYLALLYLQPPTFLPFAYTYRSTLPFLVLPTLYLPPFLHLPTTYLFRAFPAFKRHLFLMVRSFRATFSFFSSFFSSCCRARLLLPLVVPPPLPAVLPHLYYCSSSSYYLYTHDACTMLLFFHLTSSYVFYVPYLFCIYDLPTMLLPSSSTM